MISFLDLDVELLDSMLLRILGGSEGDDLASILTSQSAKAVDERIDGRVMSQRVRFVAHKPRQPGGTQICTDLDGKTYAADDPNIPAIPQHFGCRSQYQFYDGLLSAS